VLSLINTTTGEVRSRVIPDVTGASLRKVMSQHIDMTGSVLYTDGWRPYFAIGKEFQRHEYVDHDGGEYVRGEVTTNQAEGYFSQLKRSIDGTHHHVSVEHLPRYLAEFDFRYTTRKMSDTARMGVLMGRVGGRRLTYKRIAG
jgi:transposase-like protein